MSQRDAARRVENLGPRPPHFLYYSVFKAPTPYPRHLLYIRSSCSVFEVSNLYPRHLLRIRCAGFVCAAPALHPKPICPASHTTIDLHVSVLPRRRSPGISAPVPASSSFPLPSLFRPALHATESLCSDMGAHVSLPFLQISYPCKQEMLFSRETFTSTFPVCPFPDFLFPQYFFSC